MARTDMADERGRTGGNALVGRCGRWVWPRRSKLNSTNSNDKAERRSTNRQERTSGTNGKEILIRQDEQVWAVQAE